MPSYTQRFIKYAIYNNTNGNNSKCAVRNTGNDGGTAQGTSKEERSTGRNDKVGSNWRRGVYKLCESGKFARRSLQTLLKFQVAHRKGAQSFESASRGNDQARQKEKAKVTLPQKLFLSLFYLDAIDSCPSYAIIMLKELWL